MISRASRYESKFDDTRRTHLASKSAFSAARSFRFARRIAADMNGATILEKPEGVPRCRSDLVSATARS
jgi:hypothetical protein